MSPVAVVGWEPVLAYASQGEGANIVVSDVNVEAAQSCVEKVEETGQRGLAIESDVTKEAECIALVDETLKTFGQVDILVNNAGHFGENLGLPFTNQTEGRLGR